MTFIAAAVIGGGVGLASAGINAMSQHSTNSANAMEAQKNRDFQERMANTAHVREVADLKAAGLNPMLSMGAPGAATPSGSVAQMQNEVDASQVSAGVGKGIEAKMAENQSALIEENIRNVARDSAVKGDQRGLLREQTRAAKANAEQAEMASELMRAGLGSAKAMAPIDPYLDAASRALGIVGGGMSLRNSARSLDMKQQQINLQGLKGVPVK